MAKTTTEWAAIFKARNARRKKVTGSDRKFNKEMGRHLAAKTWDKNAGAPRA